MTATANPKRWSPTTWCAIVFGAIPVAWLVAVMGFTLPVVAPGRDIALLLAWSICEEIVFRGGIQPMIARAMLRRMPAGAVQQDLAGLISWANLLTSLLFCAAHTLHKPLLVVFGLMPVSLVLGASLERTRRLWVPVAMHAYFNLLLYGASGVLVA